MSRSSRRYGMCALLYCAIEDRKEARFGVWLPLGLLLWAVLFTASYVWLMANPLYQEIAFGAMVALVVYRCIRKAAELRSDRICRLLLIEALATCGLGFLAWNLDVRFCPPADSKEMP